MDSMVTHFPRGLVIFRPPRGNDLATPMDFMETHFPMGLVIFPQPKNEAWEWILFMGTHFHKDSEILALSKGNSRILLNYNYMIIISRKIILNNSIIITIMLLREMANVVQLLFSLVSYFLIKDGKTWNEMGLVQTCSDLSRLVQICPELFRLVQTCRHLFSFLGCILYKLKRKKWSSPFLCSVKMKKKLHCDILRKKPYHK